MRRIGWVDGADAFAPQEQHDFIAFGMHFPRVPVLSGVDEAEQPAILDAGAVCQPLPELATGFQRDGKGAVRQVGEVLKRLNADAPVMRGSLLVLRRIVYEIERRVLQAQAALGRLRQGSVELKGQPR